jgi:hypothetical protein
MTDNDLVKIFTYHAPKAEQPAQYEALRAAGLEFARKINALCPDCRERSLAVTSVQQAVMWANAAKAIHE